ncbi:MAG: hypothetical protein EOS58_19175 [Mesorhizobium sp.]|nr:hypothetical protein EJ073_18865 [Mesorhizobium sp. M4B.F.Ca.ET.058.02.1.1]RWD02864.1 MAG: hypothetical protein EOS58_19175 [Mesorhizobium sp.]RWD11778.1 MAG: hypothetical protein EOS74_24860 [Mesorhizobium sp.]RWD53097.1 MAG: hypothetical protein EOS75_27760 [Mesorhizobium sp.]TIX65098.1 MAG: hypothetical protein E5V30_27935 [Mesorhizobium sp.]
MPGRAMRGSADFDSYGSKLRLKADISAWPCLSAVGAAPHLPSGILSPYSDGERGAVINGFANWPATTRHVTNASASTI